MVGLLNVPKGEVLVSTSFSHTFDCATEMKRMHCKYKVVRVFQDQ